MMDLSRFKYDETSPSCLTRDGLPVGYLNHDGYWRMKLFKNKLAQVHRVIWEITNGPIPSGMQIDHVNRVKSDNRIENLRLATPKQNSSNSKRKKSTLVGVRKTQCGKFYTSCVTVDGKRRTFGKFNNKYDAALNRDIIAWGQYGEFGNYNFHEFIMAYMKK